MFIRRMTESDTDAVRALIERNLREIVGDEDPAEDTEKAVRQHSRDALLKSADNAHRLVAVCDGGSILGCGAIEGEDGALLTVYGLPELHRQGIGRKIVRALEDEAVSRRARRIEVPVSAGAAPFFEKLGYTVKSGGRKPGRSAAVCMEKKLA